MEKESFYQPALDARLENYRETSLLSVRQHRGLSEVDQKVKGDRYERLKTISASMDRLLETFGHEAFNQLSKDEQSDIAEFLANLDLAYLKEVAPFDAMHMQRRFAFGRGGKVDQKFVPMHDAFHMIEEYKQTAGQTFLPEFVTQFSNSQETLPRSAYTDPQNLLKELYPELFFGTITIKVEGGLKSAIGVLADPNLRRQFAQEMKRDVNVGNDAHMQSWMNQLELSLQKNVPETPEERLQEFEQLEKLIEFLLSPVELTDEEIQVIEQAFTNLPHDLERRAYRDVALHAFSLPQNEVPQFVYNEILHAARLIPAQAGNKHAT